MIPASLLENVRNSTSLPFALALLVTRVTFGAGTTEYSFRQVNFVGGAQQIHEKNVGPDPIDYMLTETTPNSSYEFDVAGIQRSPTSLSTRASLTTSANQLGNAEAWVSAKASAVAKASLVDHAFVQGATGVPGGTVVFHWTVHGTSKVGLKTSRFDIIDVNNLSTSTVLRSTVPGLGSVLLNELNNFPKTFSSNDDFLSIVPASTGAIEYSVPWQGGTEVPVFFDMTTRVDLDITNNDAAGFDASLEGDFLNTADLMMVDILDGNGDTIPGARLVSSDTGFEYPLVPEPSSLFLLAIGLISLSRVRADCETLNRF